MWHPADPVCTFKTGAPVTVLSGEGNGSVQRCPFYWHITTLTFSWSKLHYVPHGLHLLLAFEASVDDIYREALHDSPYTPTCEMRLLLQGQKTPHCTTSKMAWRHKHMALLHQRCFYIFVSNCTVELLGTCSLVDETLLWKRQTSSFTPKLEHLIMALFPHLPKCCRYEHNGKYLTS